MPDGTWRHKQLLAGIRDTFESVDDMNSESFMNGLPDVDPGIKAVYFERLDERRQNRFMECIWRLAKPEDFTDSQTRNSHFECLAGYYDCIFLWVEEGNPGTVRDFP